MFLTALTKTYIEVTSKPVWILFGEADACSKSYVKILKLL